ncbi:MAG: hypothetical protein ACLRUZ_14495 [Faecalimonas sp.]
MQQYKITFGVELNAEKLCAIERDFGIPAHFDTIYIEANSPRHAIRLFLRKVWYFPTHHSDIRLVKNSIRRKARRKTRIFRISCFRFRMEERF